MKRVRINLPHRLDAMGNPTAVSVPVHDAAVGYAWRSEDGESDVKGLEARELLVILLRPGESPDSAFQRIERQFNVRAEPFLTEASLHHLGRRTDDGKGYETAYWVEG